MLVKDRVAKRMFVEVSESHRICFVKFKKSLEKITNKVTWCRVGVISLVLTVFSTEVVKGDTLHTLTVKPEAT